MKPIYNKNKISELYLKIKLKKKQQSKCNLVGWNKLRECQGLKKEGRASGILTYAWYHFRRRVMH